MSCQIQIQSWRSPGDYEHVHTISCKTHGEVGRFHDDPIHGGDRIVAQMCEAWASHVLVNQKIQSMKELHRFLISDPDTWREGDRWVNQETKVEYEWDGKFWHDVTEPGVIVQSDDMLYLPVHLR